MVYSNEFTGVRHKLPTLLSAAFLLFAVPFSTSAQIPEAAISGPIAAGAPDDPDRNAILNTSAIELAANGYLEEEYFIEGRANRYGNPEMETADILDSGHAYRTRFVVRRPQDSSDFNGVVIVEWFNVTAGRDLDIDWWQSGAHLVRNGYAYIGVSAQRVGVDYLKQWSPNRYGNLDVTHDGMVTDDALSYDIFSAIAAAIPRRGESPDSSQPDFLGDLQADHILAMGHSQSASRLATYLNNVHPREPVFDGVLVHGGGGRIRDDQEVKIFKIMAETDMPRRAAMPQPDTETFRQWEVAGTSHVDLNFELESAGASALQEGRSPENLGPRTQNCDRPAYSHVAFRDTMNAAIEHLRVWVDEGTAPPRAMPLQVERMMPELEFARDEFGNILGGIRLADHAVPVARNTGMNTGAGFCRLYGSHEPFDAATLEQLYPSHESYVNAVRRVAQENLEAGYILPYAAERTVRDAQMSSVGH
ncbi:MAG: alpha/beta hydrolase domain-containing protein [Pseudohongiellaceae bacterium]